VLCSYLVMVLCSCMLVTLTSLTCINFNKKMVVYMNLMQRPEVQPPFRKNKTILCMSAKYYSSCPNYLLRICLDTHLSRYILVYNTCKSKLNCDIGSIIEGVYGIGHHNFLQHFLFRPLCQTLFDDKFNTSAIQII
jgi:hypothetical protein